MTKQLRTPTVCDCAAHGFVGLTRGFVALVSPEAVSKIAHRKFGCLFAGKNVYALSCDSGKRGLLHRMILDVPRDMVVDHANGDALDNQAGNLRICTQSQNCANAKRKAHSLPKGVRRKGTDRFQATIMAQGHHYSLGCFSTAVQAAQAYDAAAIKLHGEFARTNKMMGLL